MDRRSCAKHAERIALTVPTRPIFDNIYEPKNYIMNLSELNAWAMNRATECDAQTRASIYAEVLNALECVQQGYPEWSACQQAAIEITDLLTD